MKPKVLSAIISMLLFSLSVIAQEVKPEVIASSGDTYKTTSSQISWTLGEVVMETYNAGAMTLTQGFHQPGVKVDAGYSDPVIQLSVKLYPVPATRYVMLEFQEIQEGLSVELYDMKGNRINVQPVNSQRLQIDLNTLPAAEYILKIVSAENKTIISYIIIKQN
jgi:hypothetical protein